MRATHRPLLLMLIAALALATPAVAQDEPDPAKAALDRGMAAVARGDHAAAVKAFDEAIKLDPTLPGAWYQRGLAKMNSGDTAGALSDLNRVTMLRPRHAWAFYQRGIVRMMRQDKGASADLARAIALRPKEVAFRSGRGQYRAALGQYPGAIEDLTAAIALVSDDEELYLLRGSVHIFAGAPDKAISDLDRALGLTGDKSRQAEILTTRGRARVAQKNSDAALADYNVALSLDPKSWLTYDLRARLYLRRERLARAYADARRALHLNRRASRALLGNVTAAIQAQETAAGLDMRTMRGILVDELYGWKHKHTIPLEDRSGGITFVRGIQLANAPHEHIRVTIAVCRDDKAGARFEKVTRAALDAELGELRKQGRYTPSALGTPGPVDVGGGPEGWLSTHKLTPATEDVKQPLTVTALSMRIGRVVIGISWTQAGAEVGQDVRPLVRRLKKALVAKPKKPKKPKEPDKKPDKKPGN